MKKVGLLNIQRCDSHGAVLLAFALEKIMIDFGFKPETIDYKYAGRISNKSLIIKAIKIAGIILKEKGLDVNANKQIFGKRIGNEYELQHNSFEQFRRTHLNLTPLISNPCDPILLKYDIAIVGSDVVWKPEIAACEDRSIYFLQSFSNHCKKVAYAASVGTNNSQILMSYSHYYEKAFDCFDSISIREQSMIDFIKKYTNKDVVSVIDPVFLLDKKSYTDIEVNKHRNLKEQEYIYVYLLGDNKKAIEEANKLAFKWNVKLLVDISDGYSHISLITADGESAISDGPAEFIHNVRCAKYVITDSFHATCFSMIFNVPFTVFDRGNISVRMTDLINRFGIGDRRYTGDLCFNTIDWYRINKNIEKEASIGKQYLKEAIFDEDE